MKLNRILQALSLTLSFEPTSSSASPNILSQRADTEDWSVKIINSTLARFGATEIGTWEYFVSLTLMGQYAAYKRTNNPDYLTYIQAWADRWFDDDDNLNITVDSLDDIQAGNVMLILYQETGDEKYANAATHLRDSAKDYPRTEDGAFWHAEYWEHQIWADGSFMVNPFLARYGVLIAGDEEKEELWDEVTKQLLLYGGHLKAKNELLWHAYDESKEAVWADNDTGLAPAQWCRAMGWYGLAITDILDIIPSDHPSRSKLVSRLESFLEGVKAHQDPSTGRWYQIVNLESDSRNWLETSCSCMFVYTADISLDRGYIEDDEDKSYAQLVEKGYEGVFEKVEVNDEGLTDVYDIVVGTNVGNLTSYFDRPRKVNDLHGLGALLLMNEQVVYGGKIIVEDRRKSTV